MNRKPVTYSRILNGIFYVLRSGCPWRDLPECYGPYTTCYNRYNRWTKRGIWKAIFDRLATKSKHSLHMIDSTIVRAHRSVSGAKGGNWPKVLAAHAAVARRSCASFAAEPSDTAAHSLR